MQRFRRAARCARARSSSALISRFEIEARIRFDRARSAGPLLNHARRSAP
jgi:hypothetical protein